MSAHSLAKRIAQSLMDPQGSKKGPAPRTQIFEVYADFKRRPDKSVNGVSQIFADTTPGWDKDNENVGCWNCVDCWGCTDCEEISNCTGCIRCSYSNDCTRCTDCFSCYGCSDCTRTSSSSGCIDCKRCDGCWDCIRCTRCDDCRRCSDCSDCDYCTKCVKQKGISNPNPLRYDKSGKRLPNPFLIT